MDHSIANESIARLKHALIAIGAEACSIPDIEQSTLDSMIANDFISKDASGDWELTLRGNEMFQQLMSERPLFDE